MHNSLAITDPLSAKAQPFFGRPFQVIALGGFATAITAQIKSEPVRRLVARSLIGGIDQFSDSTDLVENPEWRHTLRDLYD